MFRQRDIGFEKVVGWFDSISFIVLCIRFDGSDVIIPLLIKFFSLFCDRFFSSRSAELDVFDIDSSGGLSWSALLRPLEISLGVGRAASFDPRLLRRYTLAWRPVGKIERGSGCHTNSNAR